MSIATMILGESGTGKSASLRNLDPQQSLLIQTIRKPLPFRSKGWKPKASMKADGNVIVTDDSAVIVRAMHALPAPIIVIDDWQYLLANEFMRRSDEKGFEKFSDIGRHAWDVLHAAGSLDPERRVYILAHSMTDEMGRTRIKTIGKLLDEKITPEGMVSIVLRTVVRDGAYLFATQNNGADTTKSPMGLFDDPFIDNDLAAVDQAICGYYEIGEQQQEAA